MSAARLLFFGLSEADLLLAPPCRKDSQIEGPLDLKGRKVGIWLGGNENSLRATMAKYNLTWDRNPSAGAIDPPEAVVDIVSQDFVVSRTNPTRCSFVQTRSLRVAAERSMLCRWMPSSSAVSTPRLVRLLLLSLLLLCAALSE